MQPEKNMIVLQAIYEVYDTVYEQFAAPQALVCRPGCSSCCTGFLTITTLEGRFIIEYINRQGGEKAISLASSRDNKKQEMKNGTAGYPDLTFNEFAAACLAGTVSDDNFLGPLESVVPCPLLLDGLCRVYPARPLGCRGFMSKVQCDRTGYADMEPLMVTINTIFCQIIEHVDQPGFWGYLRDVLPFLEKIGKQESGKRADGLPSSLMERLRVTRPLPGFLVPPEEKEEVAPVLQALLAKRVVGEKKLEDFLGLANK